MKKYKIKVGQELEVAAENALQAIKLTKKYIKIIGPGGGVVGDKNQTMTFVIKKVGSMKVEIV